MSENLTHEGAVEATGLDDAGQTRSLYVIVHGIGDPAPGETTRELIEGLTVDGALAVVEEQHWLRESEEAAETGGSVAGDRFLRAFPVRVVRGLDRSATMAEVHWADLSQFPVSLFGAVGGLFGLLFGLRYPAYQAVDGLKAWPASAIRALGRLATAVLIGPIAATNLAMLALFITAVISDWVTDGVHAYSPFGDVLTGFAVLVMVGLVGAISLARPTNQVVRLIGVSLAVVAGLVILSSALNVTLHLQEAKLYRVGVERLSLDFNPSSSPSTVSRVKSGAGSPTSGPEVRAPSS